MTTKDQHKTKTVAAQSKRGLRILHSMLDTLGDEGERAWKNAHEWAPAIIPSPGTGGGRSSGVSRPTEAAAARNLAFLADPVTAMDRDLKDFCDTLKYLMVIGGRLGACMEASKRWDGDDPEPGVESLEDTNSRAGRCQVCKSRSCTGTGDDRLRPIVVAEPGELADRYLACNACRMAWSRLLDQTGWDHAQWEDFVEDRRA